MFLLTKVVPVIWRRVTSGDARKNYKLIAANFDADGAVGKLWRSDRPGFRHRDPGDACAGPRLPRQPVSNSTLVTGEAVGAGSVQHNELARGQHMKLAVCGRQRRDIS